MKLSIVTTIIIGVAMSFSSCKKDYNCVCQYQVLGVDQTEIHEIKDVKRETAKDKCKEIQDETAILIPDATCEIE